MKAVFLDLESLDDMDLSGLKGLFERLDLHMTTPPDKLIEHVGDAEVVITNKVVFDRKLLEQLPKLKLISVVATGTNNIDLEAAKALGIRVCNCRGYSSDSVVQHVFAMLLSLKTRVDDYDKAVKAGRWQAASQFCFLDYPISEIAGKTLGIIGYGNLGRAVARVAEAFGMKVLVAKRPGGQTEDRVPLQELLPQVDVLSLHCPLNEQTRNLIDTPELAVMKPDSVLINVARGGVVNEQALADALRNGQIGAAATDVLSQEPPKNGNPLLAGDIPNLMITPHSAWASYEAREKVIAQTVENIRAYQQGESVRVLV